MQHLLNHIKQLILELSKFDITLYHSNIQQHETYKLNGERNLLNYSNLVKAHLEELSNKLRELFNCHTTIEIKKKWFNLVYNFAKIQEWKLKEFFENEIEENVKEHYLEHNDVYTMNKIHLKNNFQVYLSNKNNVMEELSSFGDAYGLSKIGIWIDLDTDYLKRLYDVLVLENYIESNKQEAFVNSLNGKSFIESIKWKDISAICKFFRYLNDIDIAANVFIYNDDKRIDKFINWGKISKVFPRTLKGQEVTSKKLKSSSKAPVSSPIKEFLRNLPS